MAGTLIGFLLLTLVSSARAEDDWKKLGEAKFGAKTEEKEVPVTAARGVFKRIKLEVKDADANIEEIKITLTNGDEIEKKVRDDVDKDKETRPINLKVRENVSIKKIEVKAKSRDKSDETTIEVWGLKD